jgi:large subunit ribosomal protein L2
MGLKFYKPTSSARRHMSVADFAEVTKAKPEKKLTKAVKKSATDMCRRAELVGL